MAAAPVEDAGRVRGDELSCDLPALAAAFDLGSVLRWRFLPDGLMNLNWRIETQRGSFAVKRLADIPPSLMRSHLNVVGALASGSVPVCPAERSSTGDTVVEVSGRYYSLFRWVDGEHRAGIDLRLEEVFELGALLGRIHSDLEGLAGLGDLAEAPATLRAEVAGPERALAETDRLLSVIASLKVPQPFDAAAAGALKQRRALLGRCAGMRPADDRPRGPVGWTHGDVQYRNLLWRDGVVVAVLDWDRLRVRPYAEEVVRTAQVQFQRPDGRLDLDRVTAFTRGYRTVVSVGADALADAGARLWWKRMTDLWPLDWHYDRGDHTCDDLWVAGQPLLQWWTSHLSEVQDAFAART